jgi:hypothetical protein
MKLNELKPPRGRERRKSGLDEAKDPDMEAPRRTGTKVLKLGREG